LLSPIVGHSFVKGKELLKNIKSMDDEHKGNYLQKNTKDKVDDLIEFIQSRKEENELMKK